LRDKKNQAEAEKSNDEEQEEQDNEVQEEQDNDEVPPNTNLMKRSSQYKVKNENI